MGINDIFTLNPARYVSIDVLDLENLVCCQLFLYDKKIVVVLLYGAIVSIIVGIGLCRQVGHMTFFFTQFVSVRAFRRMSVNIPQSLTIFKIKEVKFSKT